MDLTGILVVGVLVLMIIVFIANYKKNASYRMISSTVKEVEVSERHRKNGETFTAYVPIYEYEVDGVKYTARGAMTEDGSKNTVGNTRNIAVNKNDPNDIRLVKHNLAVRNIGFLVSLIGILIIVLAYFLVSS